MHPNSVAISIAPPDWYTGRRYSKLAPEWSIVLALKNNTITEAQYVEAYYKLLKERKLDPYKVVEELGDGAIMLCYEKSSQFCHRVIVRDWIRITTGIVVEELSKKHNVQSNKKLETLFTF